MKKELIVAFASNKAIGFEGDMPWKLSSDLKYFKSKTTGKAVIMGRKTFDSIGRPLPGRLNIVISRDSNLKIAGCETCVSLEQAYSIAQQSYEEAVVMGGGEIYALALESVDTLYITHVDGEPEADTFFPEYDESQWDLVSSEGHEADEKNTHNFTFCEYQRKL